MEGGDARAGGGGGGDGDSRLKGAGDPCPAWAEGRQASRGACQLVALAGWGPNLKGRRNGQQQLGPLGSSLGSKRSIQQMGRREKTDLQKPAEGPSVQGASRLASWVGSERMCYPRSPNCCSGAHENPRARI